MDTARLHIDEKDLDIIALLRDNSKLTSRQISKKLRVPITTVHNRVKKLEDEGVITGYSLFLDQRKLGKNISAYILITVDYKSLDAAGVTQFVLAKKIRHLPGVERVDILTGDTDILARVRTKDIDELNELLLTHLRHLKGVDKTKTSVILQEV